MEPMVAASAMPPPAVPLAAPGSQSVSPPASISASELAQQKAANRRPLRKSTLTQQQKNHKRQRATQDQLITLEMEFNKNPTPTAAVRERISEEINMTERSVQIWFQNRRAKIKMIAKKGMETGEGCDSIPESMRQYLALNFDPNTAPARSLINKASGVLSNPMADASSGKTLIQHLSCRSLRIGTWRRIGQHYMELVTFFSPEKACMTYYINNDAAGYKIEYPFSYIKNIFLEPEDPPSATGIAPRPGGLAIELTQPPNFYMDSSGSGGFYQCRDFTEDQQASKSLIHYLGGHPKVLGIQLSKLLSLESFQNRHVQPQQPDVSFPFNGNAVGVSGINVFPPISPATAPLTQAAPSRPASQPSHFAHAARSRPQSAIFADNYLSANMPPRGHKRQRSRSVPAAVDYSMLHANSQPFSIPHPSAPFQFQQPATSVFPPQQPSRLQIDTSFHYPLDLNRYALSATTTPPADFANASFLSTATTPNIENQFAFNYMAPSLQEQSVTPVGQPAAAPLAQVGLPTESALSEPPPSAVPQTGSPLSHVSVPASTISEQTAATMPTVAGSPISHVAPPDPALSFSHTESPLSHVGMADPAITEQSPSVPNRAVSADMITSPEPPATIDESILLSELYSKQNLGMSTSPSHNDSMYAMALQDVDRKSVSNDYYSFINFEAIDPNGLES